MSAAFALGGFDLKEFVDEILDGARSPERTTSAIALDRFDNVDLCLAAAWMARRLGVGDLSMLAPFVPGPKDMLREFRNFSAS